MKKNHRVCKFFIGIFIVILITVLGFSLTLKSQCNKVLKESGLTRAISNHLMDNMLNIKVFDSKILNDIGSSMIKSKSMDKIVNKITDKTVTNALEGKKRYEYVDLKPELEEICDESISSIKAVSPKLYDKVRKSMVELIPEVEKTINDHARAYIDDEFSREDTPQMKLLNTYIIMTSLPFKAVCGIALIILLFVYWKLRSLKSDFLKGLGICFILSAVLFMIMQLFGNDVIMELSNRYLGRSVSVDLQYYIEALILGSLGVIWFLFGTFMKKKGN